MIRQVHQAARRKISDFIRLEEGRVSHRHALTAAALVTTSALAGILLSPQPVSACDCSCYEAGCNQALGQYCCWIARIGCPNNVLYQCDTDGGPCG